MKTYILNEKEIKELNKANMNDLIRACLGTLLTIK